MPMRIPDTRRAVLILLAWIAGAAVPIHLVLLSFGYAQYWKDESLGPKVVLTAHEFAKFYIPLVYLPAMALLIGITLYCRKRYRDVYRRIIVGLVFGAVCTIVLDAIRLNGVVNGWLPGDTPIMFGKMATGSTKFAAFFTVGQLVHFMNGAGFGLFYTFVWGKRGSYKTAVFWGVVWLLFLELGMMLGPPVGPMVGPFGVRYMWPQLFLLTLVAHIGCGVALGLLVQKFLKDEDRGWLLPFIRGESADRGAEQALPSA